MTDVHLTEGNDVYTHPRDLPYAGIFGLAGDDLITIDGGANVEGGPGNDVIVNLWNGSWSHGGVAFWRSPGAILVDLEAGYALDGWGGRDTITNFRHVHSSGRDGDTVLGSAADDDLLVNGFNWHNRSPGRAYVDGRGGQDMVTLWDVDVEGLNFATSSDGRIITVTGNGYTATLNNVEVIRLVPTHSDWEDRIETDVRDLIDFTQVGAATLLAPGVAAWGGTSITFSFMAAAPSYGGSEGGTGFVAPTPEYQHAVRNILAQLGGQLGVGFVEVADTASAYGQLRFGINQQVATKGYAFIPGTVAGDRAGDVWLDVETLAVLQPGQEGWQTLLHEIGHALGLSHPIAEGTDTQATVLLDAWNHQGYTVMSPHQAAGGLWPSWFGPLDMQALQQLYGARSASVHPGHDVHRLADSQGLSLASLRDSGGADTLDASGLSVGAFIDLTPGAYSSVGLTAQGAASVNNLLIEHGTVIESAVGTSFDDVLLGNGEANLFWPGTGNDWIDGQAGIDTVLYEVLRSARTVQRLDDGSGAWVVADAEGAEGSDTLWGIERVYFSDVRVVLDVSGRATDAARITATVFGPDGLAQPATVGSVLLQLDAGATELATYASALASARYLQLAGGSDDVAFVKQMFRNLVGVEATDAMAQPFVDQFLASGAYTQAAFAQAVSAIAPVDLVGLAQSGLAYIY